MAEDTVRDLPAEPAAHEERRRAPRRAFGAESADDERRSGDRRKRQPGISGLLQALFGSKSS